MKKQKWRLTQAEEFEILKNVLDKFLWLGFIIMGLGLYSIFQGNIIDGFTWIIAGSIVLILFIIIIIKEFEII